MALNNQALLDYIAAHPGAGRDDIRQHVAPDVSPPTIWRALKRLVDEGKLEVSGKARATSSLSSRTEQSHNQRLRRAPWIPRREETILLSQPRSL